MPRYIDADKVIEKIVNTPSMLPYEYDFDEKALSLLAQRQNEILDIVETNVPTENVAPVVHAHKICKPCGVLDLYVCSNCKGSLNLNDLYCPNCGAKMDEEVNDG